MNIQRIVSILFFILVFVFRIEAQTNSTSTEQDTFRVKAVVSKVTVIPERSFLYLNENNLFRITYTGKNKLGRMELKGGTIDKKDSLYNFKATEGTSAILVIYEKLKNGTEKIAFTCTYKLFGREVPRVSLDGVPNDSVEDKFTIIALGKLRAKPKYGSEEYVITSFKIYIKNGNKFDTLSAKGNQLTLEMKRKIDSMDVRKNGGILMFENIKAVGPGGRVVDLPPLRIYMRDEKLLQFGNGG